MQQRLYYLLSLFVEINILKNLRIMHPRKLINEILFRILIYPSWVSADPLSELDSRWCHRDLSQDSGGGPRFLSEWEISSWRDPASVLSSKASAISNRIKVLAGILPLLRARGRRVCRSGNLFMARRESRTTRQR